MLRLYENRAGPPNRGPASCDPRPRVNGLGSFHINATGRASPPSRAGNLANTHAQVIRIIQNAQTTLI